MKRVKIGYRAAYAAEGAFITGKTPVELAEAIQSGDHAFVTEFANAYSRLQTEDTEDKRELQDAYSHFNDGSRDFGKIGEFEEWLWENRTPLASRLNAGKKELRKAIERWVFTPEKQLPFEVDWKLDG